MAENEGWKSPEAARHHMKTADILTPGRKDIFSVITRLAAELTPDEPYIMDIGCGNGDLTDEILSRIPSASVYMVDYSDEMIRLARERFGNNKKIQIIKQDLNSGVPDTLKPGTLDAVVSCFALHHISYENRVKLYSRIKRVLKEDGLFIAGDRFTGESPVVSEWENDNWISWMNGQIKEKMGKELTFHELKKRQSESDKKLEDMPGTVWDMQRDLKKAGFPYVDCLYKNQNMGVIAAVNR